METTILHNFIQAYLPFTRGDAVYAGNTILEYVVAVLVFIGLVIVFRFIQWVVLRKLAQLAKKTETDIDDTLIRIVQSLRPAFYYFIAFFFAIQTLSVSGLGSRVITVILVSWIAYQIVIALQILIDFIIIKKFADKDGDGEADDGIILFMSRLAKTALWLVAALMVLSNLGVNVTGLMAGLGVGGLAIAFALQNVFADLFASFSIYLDKPFEVGDFVQVGSHIGTIEKIGIKTTRLRALQGEEIVISNQELTSTRINNFKKLEERRISTQFGVVYDTTVEQINTILEIVEKIVTDAPSTRFDRVHFTTFGDSALLFDLVYYIESYEYVDYLDAQQKINLEIKQAFEKEGIEMAFPTQTIHLVKS